MKRLLLINYLITIIAWCLYLSHYVLSSFFMLLLSSGLMTICLNKIKYLRVAMVFMVVSSFTLMTFKISSLDRFYSFFEYFVLAIGLNVSLSCECSLRAKNIYSVHLAMMIIMFTFMSVAIILPDSWYSIFTKINLYSLIAIIFMPYAATLSLVLLKKENVQMKKAFSR